MTGLRISRWLCILWLVSSSVTLALDLPDNLKVKSGFADKEQWLELDKGKSGILTASGDLKPGYYALDAEYRTEGFDPAGRFAVDIKASDMRQSLSGYEWTPAAKDWVPLRVYFRVDNKGPFNARFANMVNAQNGSKVFLRNIRYSPFEFKDGANFRVNSNWDKGTENQLPPMWYPKGKKFPDEQHCLAKNTTFKTGKHVLRFTAKEGEIPMLCSSAMPFPKGGEIEFSAWVRGKGKGSVIMHVVAEGWNPRVEGGGPVRDKWTLLTAKLPVPANINKKFFFVRFDSRFAGTMEIADAKVTWYANGKKDPEGTESFLEGWQGAPGRNVVYNPDFELGGYGYFYGYSWPKKYKDYEKIRATKPVKFLKGKGPGGSTCAHIRGILRTFCFPVTTGKTYTFSIDLRAPEGMDSTEAMLYGFDTEWKNALWKKVTDIPGEKWKRYSWTVKWKQNNIQRKAYFRIDSPKGVLADRLQVVEGKGGDYEAPAVMLGMMYKDLPYFVRGRDQTKATIKVVPGQLRRGTAKVKVVATDAWKREVWQKTVDVPLDKVTLIPVDLPAKKLGTFHVDLKATEGDKVAGLGFSRYAIIDPPVLQKAEPGKPGIFGICQESFNYPVWMCELHAKIQTDIGIRLNRFFASVPPDLPYPIPQEFTDDVLSKCRPFNKAGIELLPCIEYLIPGSVQKNSKNTGPAKQKDLDAFGKALGQYVTAMKPAMTYWEILNEPNLWRMTSGPERGKRTMFPEKYLAFQKVAYQTIKKVDPKMQVVCNALNNIPKEWVNKWFQSGGGKYMDIFSFHPYGFTNFYPEYLRLKKQLAKYNFDKPLLNSEKYYGTNIYQERSGYEETKRGYFLPHGQELGTAGRTMQHSISHAAARIPYCIFAPHCGVLFSVAPETMYVYDGFPALNAATRFLVNAGEGRMMQTGDSLVSFIFPDAPEGPLVVIWTEQVKSNAALLGLKGEYKAYDMMGNLYDDSTLKKEGIRIALDPSYLQFKAGTTVRNIEQALTSADIVGLGDPFKANISLASQKSIKATVSVSRNRPMSGKVSLVSLPQGWKAVKTEQEFKELAPGKSIDMEFRMSQMPLQPLASYPVSFMVESGKDYIRREVILRPLFADSMKNLKIDGKLSDWPKDGKITLSDGQTSKDFDPDQKRNGDQDLSAKVAFGWTPEGLALAIEVTDDNRHVSESERMGWDGDSVQLFIDPLNDSLETGGHTDDDVAYTIFRTGKQNIAWLDKGVEGKYKGTENQQEALNDTDVKLSIVTKGKKTIYEMLLPWDKCLPGAEYKNGGNIGLSLLINDNDGKGRKIGLTLSPKGTEPYGHPQNYVDLILRP